MEFLNFYKEVLKCNSPDDVFNYFISQLKPSILLWSYFVNWDKVFFNTKKIEIALNNFNYLIGKQDFDNEFKFLIRQNPLLITDGFGWKTTINSLRETFDHNKYVFNLNMLESGILDYVIRKLIR